MHWNEKHDPVDDKDYPNIREYVPNVDNPFNHDHGGCITETMEEVNPDG